MCNVRDTGGGNSRKFHSEVPLRIKGNGAYPLMSRTVNISLNVSLDDNYAEAIYDNYALVLHLSGGSTNHCFSFLGVAFSCFHYATYVA